MKNTLAVIAVFLAGLMNLPCIIEETLKIPSKRIIVENTDQDIIGLELLEKGFCFKEKPMIGLELREPQDNYIPHQDFTPSNEYVEELLNVKQPTCIKKPQKYKSLKYVYQPIRRLLSCFNVRYHRCRNFF